MPKGGSGNSGTTAKKGLIERAKDKIKDRREKKQKQKDVVRRAEFEVRDTTGKSDQQKADIEKAEGIRKEAKKQKYIDIIEAQRGTPIEKLINTTDKHRGGSLDIAEATYQTGGATKSEKAKTFMKQGFKNVGEAVVDKLHDTFSWTKFTKRIASLNSWADGGGNFSDFVSPGGDVTDVIGDALELADIEEGKGVTANRHTGGAIGFLSAIGSSFKFVLNMINEIRMGVKGEQSNRDAQEKRKVVRTYLRELIGILESITGGVGSVIKEIPIFGPILGICSGGLNLLLDAWETVENTIHYSQTVIMRDEIYEKIQRKRVKYSSGPKADAAAAEAYTVDMGRTGRSKKVDKKRRALLEKVYGIERADEINAGVTKKPETGATGLRSRNDSAFREAQYDLARKIRDKQTTGTDDDKKAKSEKRQMEALQMMEEYRQADKSCKKMKKALNHNIEGIITGLTGLGIDIAALAMTAADGGASTIIAGFAATGYDYARSGVSKGYKALRIFAGSEANKATTREDMAVSLMNKMETIADSNIWVENAGKFTDKAVMEGFSQGSQGYKDVINQGRNVEHLHKIFRNGLDANMQDLITAKSRSDLKEKIAESFGQED